MYNLKTVKGGPENVILTRDGVVHVEPRHILASDNAKKQLDALKRIIEKEEALRQSGEHE